MRNLWYSIFLLYVLIPSNSIAQITLEGKLKESSKKDNVVSALLSLYQNDSMIYGSISDTLGFFTFENIKTGQYSLKISYLGQLFVYDSISVTKSEILPPYILNINDNLLDGVTVKAKRPLVTREIDRSTLIINDSPLLIGENGYNILRFFPGVIINPQGNISIKGKSGIRLLINGRLQNISSDEIRDYLISIPSEQIESIELITSPPASYDATGTAALINLKIKRNKEKGIIGSGSLSYAQGKTYNGAKSFLINYNTKKFFTSIGYSFSDNNNFDDGDELRLIENRIFNQDYRENYRDINNRIKFSTMYDYNNQNFGISAEAFNTRKINNFTSKTLLSTENKLDSIFEGKSYIFSSANNLRLNMFYDKVLDSLGKKISFNLDYNVFNRNKKEAYENYFFDSNLIQTRNPEIFDTKSKSNIEILSSNFDYKSPISEKIKYEIGFKFSKIFTENDFEFLEKSYSNTNIPIDNSNRFEYTENISSTYFNLIGNVGSKFSYQGGLRYERTDIETNSITSDSVSNVLYNNLFPSIFLNYDLNDEIYLRFNLNRRINRPFYNYLNPFVEYFDPYSYAIGNPYLKPEFSNSVELTLTYKNFDLSLEHTQIKDEITMFSRQINEKNLIIYEYLNLAKSNEWSITSSYQESIFSWWEIFVTAIGYRSVYVSSFTYAMLDRSLNSLIVGASNTFTLPKGFILAIAGTYNSPSIVGGDYFFSYGNLDVAIKKKLSDKINLAIIGSDLLYTSNQRVINNFDNQNIELSHKFDTRRIACSFSYSFSRGKTSTKRTKTNDLEENNRISD